MAAQRPENSAEAGKAVGACPTPRHWEDLLIEVLHRPVHVSFGRSHTVPVRAQEKGRPVVLEVRLHRAFADAPEDVCGALARWLLVGRRARRACTLLDGWIEQRMRAEPKHPRTPAALLPQGETYDLSLLAREVQQQFLANHFNQDRPVPGLTWGRRARSRSRHSLRLGSYDPATHVVRIHPVLDQPQVPRWFVCFVLSHELLHARWPPKRGSGKKWIHHGAEFRAHEASHPDYERALAWEKLQLPGLIRSARNGTPFKAKKARRFGGLL